MPTLRTRALPWVVRLPLLASAMIFAVAVGTSQIAIWWMFSRQEAQAHTLTRAWLDGVAAAVEPYVRSGDRDRLEDTASRLLARTPELDVRRLVVLRGDGAPLASVGRADTARPEDLTRRPGALLYDDGEEGAWLARPMADGEDAGWVAAWIDLAGLAAEQRALRLWLLAIDLLLSAGCALIGYGLVKRMLRPVEALTGRLEAVDDGRPDPVPPAELPPAGTEFGRLLRGYNTLVAAVHEREVLSVRLAEQDKAAVLGRLAATVAHEVRNPLGGLVNTVDTLRRFGHDEGVRGQALDILDRGLAGIGEVVRAVLDTYRAPAGGRPLAAEDFAHLPHHPQPAATRRRVSLDWTVEVPDRMAVDATRTRQIVLNLLLNACAATPAGGRVRFSASVSGAALLMAIADEGPGLPGSVAARLKSGGDDRDTGGSFGIAVVVRLVEALNGRVSVRSAPGRGTEIALTLPFAEEAVGGLATAGGAA